MDTNLINVITSNLKSPEEILEIGTGRGSFTKLLSTCFPESGITSIDKNEKFRNRVPDFRRVKNCTYRICDLDCIDFLFDLVALGSEKQTLWQHFNWFTENQFMEILIKIKKNMRPEGKILIVTKKMKWKTDEQKLYCDSLLKHADPKARNMIEKTLEIDKYVSGQLKKVGFSKINNIEVCITDRIETDKQIYASTGFLSVLTGTN